MVQAVIKNDNGFFLIISMRMTFEREIYANCYVEGFFIVEKNFLAYKR